MASESVGENQIISLESANYDKGVAKIKAEFVLPNAKKEEADGEPESKKPRKVKGRQRGQNKARGVPWRADPRKQVCVSLVDVREGEAWPSQGCGRHQCPAVHDAAAFLAAKPADLGARCHLFETLGRCPRGLACRFGSHHLTPEGFNRVDPRLYDPERPPSTSNQLDKDVQNDLRKHKYDFGESEQACQQAKADQSAQQKEGSEKSLGPVSDADLITLKPEEKPKIDWRDKLYLSPLTTLGNLPYRRICKQFGADVTCGEMAVATSILQGLPQEWALVRRHESEDLFGAQVCGNNPLVMAKCAQVLAEQTDLDFVDINMGCPIDLIYQQGAGSALLRRHNVLQQMVKAMAKVAPIPVTIKTRTGVYSDKRVAHSLIPKLKTWGVSLITLHGRSREQRYTKSADWEYIDECAGLAAPIPLFGNGDILSFEDYNAKRQLGKNISGVMIGRGALIKPWIFTEIKEQRNWDISSQERLQILKDYTNFGLEHWGSDDKGVENTRRFLLEWLSFLYRYIPVGVLERPPQNINERPPLYRGRDDLETLMASPNCADWVKISEMLLGPLPDGFQFVPKHKANAW
ncbi:tRNA-dihydrouridine(47) synthase [NAD(P)(+)]-like [Neocloeon triangulifer]|uniref:tRNA-dihydrouridine(47) synthase [NAD(P)(+)]-like n=1 Tax=Neocloeon triangulifer TaxID=2078957 RepID=UPI00286F9074|nr:tRNA-dihydrouridine(47) synthase [NAD(P)(+)]-like [Neocloeon triangulifer]